LRTKPMWLAVISAAIFAMALRELPHQLGLVIAAVFGICIGYASQQIGLRLKPPTPPSPSNKGAAHNE